MAKDAPSIYKISGRTFLFKHILSECYKYTNDLTFFNILYYLDTSFGPHSDSNKQIINLKKTNYIVKFN